MTSLFDYFHIFSAKQTTEQLYGDWIANISIGAKNALRYHYRQNGQREIFA